MKDSKNIVVLEFEATVFRNSNLWCFPLALSKIWLISNEYKALDH